jgi:hypothetical protein
MKRILGYEEFKVNEDSGMMQLLGSVLAGKKSAKDIEAALPDYMKKLKKDGSYQETPAEIQGDDDSEDSEVKDDFELKTNYNVVPGNDDFALYLQHQQGVAGAAGIIRALNGTGTMHPDTIKTKNGVKYANLVGNIPKDKPQAKRDLIAALDAGDQKTAAAIFYNMWKEKWNERSARAKKAINETRNADVKKAIQQATDKYGVPFDFAVTVAMIESGLIPTLGNNKYKGLFAMDPNQSYGGIVTPMGNKWADPFLNADNGVKLLRRDIVQFKKQLGKDLAVLDLSPWAKNLA